VSTWTEAGQSCRSETRATLWARKEGQRDGDGERKMGGDALLYLFSSPDLLRTLLEWNVYPVIPLATAFSMGV
jgi:hypothetical protein